MIYLVIGMSFSGTTMFAKSLQRSGVAMVEKDLLDLSYSQGNLFERQDFKEINYELLGRKRVLDSKPLNMQGVSAGLYRKAERLIRSCDETGTDWGFKDPRVGLTYEFWKELLPAHKTIVVYRHPRQVWDHYYDRYGKKTWFPRVISCWIRHNSNIMKHIQADNDNIYVQYENYLSGDSEHQRIENLWARQLTDVRSVKEHRFQSKPGLVFDTAALLSTRFTPGYKSVLARLAQRSAQGRSG